MIRSIMLMIIALILVVIFSPIIFIFGLFIYRKKLTDYFYTIAIGLDQLAGSILYAQPDWTVSSWTYYRCRNGNKYCCYFMRFIDFIFGKDHCKKAFWHEVNITKKYDKIIDFTYFTKEG